MLICRNGHLWKSRGTLPKKCHTCGTKKLWNIDIHNLNPPTLIIDMVDSKNPTKIFQRAQAHSWEIPRLIQLLSKKWKDAKMNIRESITVGNVEGRMGVSIPVNEESLNHFDIEYAEGSFTKKLKESNEEIKITIHCEKQGHSFVFKPENVEKNTKESIFDYNGVLYEVRFVFPFSCEIDKNDKQLSTYLQYLRDYLKQGKAKILFEELGRLLPPFDTCEDPYPWKSF